MEATQVSIPDESKRYNVYMCIHTHTHTHTHYSATKKNEILPFAATWMDLEDTILSEISQSEKDKYYRT